MIDYSIILIIVYSMKSPQDIYMENEFKDQEGGEKILFIGNIEFFISLMINRKLSPTVTMVTNQQCRYSHLYRYNLFPL